MKSNDVNLVAGHLLFGLSLFLSGCGQVVNAAGTPELDDIDGYGLLVDTIRYSGGSEAVRHSGGSEAIVHSGRFEMTQTRTYLRPAREGYGKELQRQPMMLKERQAKSDEVTRIQSPVAINCAPNTFGQRMRVGMHVVDQMRFVFEGVTPSRRTAVVYQDTDESGIVSDACVRISATQKRGQLLEEGCFVNHDVATQPGYISIEEGARFLESPNEFGRLRGRTWKLLTMMLRDDQAGQFGRLDEETVRLGRKLNRKLLRESNGAHGVRIVGKEEIEGSMCPIVETDDPGDTNLRSYVPKIRVWIDPERGFITPRIVELANGKSDVEYVSSDYQFLEDAGLWWPRVHVVTNRFERSVTRYEFDLESSCVNCPIDEAEFELAVAPGNHLNDLRDGRSQPFVIQKPYRMVFGHDGHLNFDVDIGVAVKDPAFGFGRLELLFSQPEWLLLLLANMAFGSLVLLVYRFRIRHE